MSDGFKKTDRAKELASSLAGALNVAGLFAAPRVLAQAIHEHKGKPIREELAAVLEHALKTFGSSAETKEILQPLGELRGHLATWDGQSPAAKSIVKSARAALLAMGVPEPNEGWDHWEGAPEEPEPRPKPAMPRILRQEPMPLDEWLAYDGPGELVDGFVVEEKAMTPLRVIASDWFVALLRDWASPRGGAIFGRGHKLAISSTTGRKPDICTYMPQDRSGKVAMSLAPKPTLIVEVASADRVELRRDRMTAMREYANLGVPWYWIVSPLEGLFEIWTLEADGHYALLLTATDGNLPETGLEDLAIDLDAFWAAITPKKP